MKNTIRLLVLVLLLSSGFTCFAQVKGDEDAEMFNKAKVRDQKAIDEAEDGWWTASMKTHDERIQWWREARFGMFIHWGVYSLPAGEWKGKKVNGYAEHLMRKEKISREEYLSLAHQFDPVKFNADEWVKEAKKAGMRYLIITAKHHDGFAMYNSSVSDFNVVKQTAWHHDPMVDLSAACKKYGIKFGFYYSHAFDWEHPDAPGNDWEYKNPGGDLGLYGGTNWYDVHPELLAKAQRYVDQKAIPQIRELLTRYHPDILWFDTPQKLPLSENIRILKAIRETDPNVVVNGRLVRSATANFGDYKNTADRPAEFYPVKGDWEAIPTTNESYGYSKYDNSHKPASFFIQLLAKSVAKGGNLLLNIGPKGDGEFDSKDTRILDSIGLWMSKNSSSIYGAGKSPLPLQNWGVTTLKGNKLYLHIFNWPVDGKLYVGGLKTVISKAYLLEDEKKKPLILSRSGEIDWQITVPKQAPDQINTVIVAKLQAPVQTDSLLYVAPNVPVTRLLAFDAQLSKGFKFGDGKASRYYVENWQNTGQTVQWHFRTIQPQRFKVMIKYLAGGDAGGTYRLSLGDLKASKVVSQTHNGSAIITDPVGRVSLKAGVHTLLIKPEQITGKELMKLLEVQLIPVNGARAD
ncbi:alpha-L-fucosidase [Pedobacter sp. BS3]|uniref:alpha-L-fucosidase n=1 Tax=Pedobacter sp. BS3 TaxID=2567937 RepID=UPI0011ECCADF|nr:alpha-L-fucosidase [Pedobacter sp. BS3]TZF83098.1 alpha-L-fucosidase [Pedobacter sp. BS3]